MDWISLWVGLVAGVSIGYLLRRQPPANVFVQPVVVLRQAINVEGDDEDDEADWWKNGADGQEA